MRIRTILTAAVSASSVMALVLALASWIFVGRLDAAADVQARAQISAREVSEMLALAHEYAWHPEERMVQQWKVHLSALNKAIAPKGSVAEAELQPVLMESLALSKVFAQLETLDATEEPSLNARRRQLLLDQLLTKARLVVDAVQHWVDVATTEHRAAEQNFRRVAVLLPVLLLVLLAMLTMLLIQRVLRPLAQLRTAVAAVAKGDHLMRTASKAPDEIGDLSQAFDALAVDMVTALRKEIADREQVQLTLAENQTRLNTIIETGPECIKIVDAQGRLLLINPAGMAMFEVDALDQVINCPVVDIVVPEHRASVTQMHQRVMDGESVQIEYEIIGRKGARRWMQTHAVPMLDHGEIVQLAVTRDITAHKNAVIEIEQLAFYDSLTKLPNRRLMHDRLRQAISGISRCNRHAALMLIDLDNFKALNDSLGHAAGDLLLVEAASRITSCIRVGDTAARMGGDEFVVILQDLEATGFAAAQAEAVAMKIQRQLNQPYLLDMSSANALRFTRKHQCTSSIGITVFTESTVTTDELMRRADAAMYQAKAAGRNVLRFFDPEMQAQANANTELESDLREAVSQRQLLLYFQAQVQSNGHLTGVEALIRWQHPTRGMVLPGEFIPLAETSGLILIIGSWVLEAACFQLASWTSVPGFEHLTMAVNVSARQFHESDFVDQVLAVLARTGANPHLLKLELTESLLVHDLNGIIAKMTTLKSIGVGFSLDDFGTGYSSLSYLKRMPLDQLKIDLGFVRDILFNPNDATIAKMVIALANSLGLTVLAEGVETLGQRDFLEANGCLTYQGYLFARPLPLREFEEYVRLLTFVS